MVEPVLLPRNLSAHVVDLLREVILAGRVAPGARLNEMEIAAELGVSRGPVREAIRALISEGLLVGVPNHGAHVLLPDRPYVGALFELRIGLETAGARLAAQRLDDGDIERLTEVCRRSRALFEADGAHPHQLDLEFHSVLLEISASPLIAEQVRRAQQQVIVSRNRLDAIGVTLDVEHESSFAEHEAIVEALATRDANRVADLMDGHLARVRDQLLAKLVDNSTQRTSGVFNRTLSGQHDTTTAQRASRTGRDR